MSKEFDPQILSKAVQEVVCDAFSRVCRAQPGEEPVVFERDIIESDGRMRLAPMQRFNTTAYASVVNFFLNAQDQKKNYPVGTLAFFVREDMVERFLKAQKVVFKDDDEGMIKEKVGDFAEVLAGELRNRLASQGYAEVLLSAPENHKNTIPDGIPFNYDLYKKTEILFQFWKQKCVVVEICMGQLPRRGA